MDWSIEFLQSLIKFFTFDKIIAILGLLAAWIGLSPQWKERSQQRTLRKEFGGDLFPADVIERSTRYYIEPYCDVMDPSREAEIRHALPSDRSLFGFIDGFLSKTGDYRHMIILADSGMGKTSALLSYYWYNRQKRESKRHRIAVVPLGIPNADEYIQQIEQKRETILFLDAFDEDTKAKNDHSARIETLMELGREFSHIILTSRTQFFPNDEEIPTETGIIRVGPTSAGQGKVYKFQKSYLLPLTDKQVTQYIHKRYPFWQWKKRKSAKLTADKIPNLRVRPMLLAFIPDLLANTKTTINHSYELYEALIEAWLERESYWVDSDKLSQFSKRLAVDLYVNRERRGAERIHYDQLIELAGKWDIELDAWQITGRSLLNRDAEGNYKFAHRSIMEYLFLRAETAALDIDWQDVVLTDQMQSFIEEMVGARRFDLLHTFPGADLDRADLYEIDLSGANLSRSHLTRTHLTRTNLSDAYLAGTDLSDAYLYGANLYGTDLYGTNLSDAYLAGTDLSGTNLKLARYNNMTKWPDEFDYRNSGAIGPDADLSDADLSRTDLSGTDLSGTNLSGTNLSGANLSTANLRRASLKLARYNDATKWPDGFNYRNSGAIGPEANLFGANLSKADLRGTDLSGANLSGVDLRKANLSGTNLKLARYDGSTKWPNRFDYRNSGAIGPDANLSEVDLSGVDLSDADLYDAYLSRADLSRTDFSGAYLSRADLYDANLSGAYLSRTDLSDADLSDADLSDADLSDADLSDADLSDADLSDADLSRADLSDADLRRTDLYGVNLKQAKYNGATKWPDGFDYRNSGAINVEN